MVTRIRILDLNFPVPNFSTLRPLPPGEKDGHVRGLRGMRKLSARRGMGRNAATHSIFNGLLAFRTPGMGRNAVTHSIVKGFLATPRPGRGQNAGTHSIYRSFLLSAHPGWA